MCLKKSEIDFPEFDCASVCATGQTGNGVACPTSSTGYTDLASRKCRKNLIRYEEDFDAFVPQFVFPGAPLIQSAAINRAEFDSSDNTLQLMSGADKNALSGVFLSEKINLHDGFELYFSFKIDAESNCKAASGVCEGADGFAVVIINPQDTGLQIEPAAGPTSSAHPLSEAWLKTNGKGLGYSGIQNSLSIEFDTYANLDVYDPQFAEHETWWINATEYISHRDNHVSVFSHGGYANSHDHSSDALITATPSIPLISDHQVHDVLIRYVPHVQTKEGTLSVFIDQQERPNLVSFVTLAKARQESADSSTCASRGDFITYFDVFYEQVPTSPIPITIAQSNTVASTYANHIRIWPTKFNFTATNYKSPQRVFIGFEHAADFTGESCTTGTDCTLNIGVTNVNEAQTVNVPVHYLKTWTQKSVIVTTSRKVMIVSSNGEITEEFGIVLSEAPADGEIVTIYARATTSTTEYLAFEPNYERGISFNKYDWNQVKNMRVYRTAFPFAGASHTATFKLFASSTAQYSHNSWNNFFGFGDTSTGATLDGNPTQTVKILGTNAMYITHVEGNSAVRDGQTDVNDYLNVRLVSPQAVGAFTLDQASAVWVQKSGTGISFTTSNYATMQRIPIEAVATGTSTANIACSGTCGSLVAADYGVEVTVAPVTTDGTAAHVNIVKPQSDLTVIPHHLHRCVLDHNGKAYIGLTSASGEVSQDVKISKLKFCEKLGCGGS